MIRQVRYFLFTLLTFVIALNCHCQNWNKLGNGLYNSGFVWRLFEDTLSDRLLIGGTFNLDNTCSGSCNNFGWWDGTSWSYFSDATGPDSRSIAKYKGNIYGGTFDVYPLGAKPRRIGMLVGNTWVRKDTVRGRIFDYCVYNNKLYAVGSFDSIGGIKADKIAYFDTCWHALDTTTWKISSMDAVIGYNNEIYVIGNFRSHDNTIYRMAKWNGTSWSNVGGNVFGYSMGVPRAMAVFQNKLYVGGTFSKIFGNPGNSLARWDGSKWDSIPSLYHAFGYATAADIRVYHDKLIIAGEFHYADTVHSPDIVAWDGIKFISFGVHKYNLPILQIGFFRDKIHVLCGDSIDNLQVNGIAYYDGNLASVSEVKSDPIKVSVLPNPFTDQILISSSGNLKGIKITIHNVLGQLIYFSEADLTNEIRINTEKISSALYYISISQNNTVLYGSKLLKQ